MLRRKKEKEDNLEKLTFFRQYLLKNFKNKEIRNNILNILDKIDSGNAKVLTSSPKNLAIQLSNGDTYTITLTDTGIETYESRYSDSTFIKQTITYYNNLIVVTIDESKSEIDNLTTLPSRILRSTEKRVYQNGEIVYQNYFVSDATSSLNNYTCKTESDEIIVNQDRMAMKRHISITNEENNIPQVRYFRCNHFYSAPWNTLDQEYVPMPNTLTECGEQAYYSFVARVNESPKEQLLKK